MKLSYCFGLISLYCNMLCTVYVTTLNDGPWLLNLLRVYFRQLKNVCFREKQFKIVFVCKIACEIFHAMQKF